MNPFFNPDQLKTYIENMQKPFLQGMPFKPEDIQKYVMDTVSQFMPDFLKNDNIAFKRTQPESEVQVFETHDFVIARIPTRFDSNLRPRLSMDSYHLYVKGLPDRNEELKLQLPCPVKPKYAKAEYKNGILEVRMLKQGPEATREINIDEWL
ncbi:hypothetical protein [Tuberibacillus calidus]|jgi:hypothetical protein|uniref:hypothetical protein n=1 Tax=Tuberibacillus calidus TaxID=340097 RepID=UPI000424520E|nr:hypothetical protein [Tuberibacillus calidus]